MMYSIPLLTHFSYLAAAGRLVVGIDGRLPARYTLPNCLGGTVVGRRTRDRKVAGSTPGPGAIKSTRSTQPSIPPG